MVIACHCSLFLTIRAILIPHHRKNNDPNHQANYEAEGVEGDFHNGTAMYAAGLDHLRRTFLQSSE